MKGFFVKNNMDIYDLLFRVGMWWRILYGFLRIILGFILLHFIGTPLSDIFYRVMSHEVIEDPGDIILRTIGSSLQHFSFTVTYFLAIYFIFWGAIDILLSINLLKHKIWVFPVSIYLIAIFVLYGIYRFSHTHSPVLAFIIVMDLVILWLIRKEYIKLKSPPLTNNIQ
jgi:uncharacterized membrane protein